MTTGPDCKKLLEDPFRGRDPAADAAKKARLGSSQPEQLGRPEGRTEHAPGPLLYLMFIKFIAQTRRVLGATRLGPGEDRSKWLTVAIEPEQAVPKPGAGDDCDSAFRQASRLAQTFAGGPQKNPGIELGAAVGRMPHSIFFARATLPVDPSFRVEKCGPN